MSPDTSGRVAKWAVRLGEFDISFRPRSALKAQVIADFITECTWGSTPMIKHSADSSHGDDIPIIDDIKDIVHVWTLYVDGASNSSGCSARLILANPDGLTLEYALRFSFSASNNQAKYEALLAGIRAIDGLGVKRLKAYSDFQLVVNQLKGEFEAKDLIMSKYLEKAKAIIALLDYFDIQYILHEKNS